ncbi:Pc20g08060 [Penicillium rubens Wisconsin 54-1255]|uniref:Pc20g08060 protein n=1 Tax=Penicillium rubens (strain ATCC 28089 / DSM 1075 / NRRL 1951 / Wisconsin 54-1255) TaxID=500485 RepID=B6HEN8_PENRW|nr:Pc20g08060 [Penicillium rubens Wisconsin 54-1255]
MAATRLESHSQNADISQQLYISSGDCRLCYLAKYSRDSRYCLVLPQRDRPLHLVDSPSQCPNPVDTIQETILKARFAEYQDKDGVPWSDSHIHYANMGGFPIQFADSDPVTDTQEIPSIADLPKGIRTPQMLQKSMQRISNAIGKIDWALDRSNILTIEKANTMVSQGYRKEEGIFNMPYTDWVRNLTLLCGNLWVVDANQLLLARELGIIEKLPYVSHDSLDDHSNGDLVVKMLALLQISWVFIQLGVRLSRNLPTSQLEIFTLSFAICSSITYITLINKPQDVRTSYTIKAVRHPSAEDLIYMANAGPLGSGPKYSVWIPNDATHRDVLKKEPGHVVSMACLFALLLFGGAHCVAWNFEFPTALERLFWRLSSVVTGVAMPFGYLLDQILGPVWLKVIKAESQPKILELVERALMVLIVVVFVLARLFIAVEVVRSLAFLPPDLSKGRISTCFYRSLKEYEIALVYVRRVMQEDIPADKESEMK